MKKAAALRYKEGDNAPKIIGLGKGEIAEKIIAIARENNIPIVVNPPLSETLTFLELGQEIPPELYRVVAEILAFIYKTTQEIP
ncbi:MAG: type III secretion system protein [Clostridia bacterium]|nr:type III secretion system protein [Clostridia bacterium]